FAIPNRLDREIWTGDAIAARPYSWQRRLARIIDDDPAVPQFEDVGASLAQRVRHRNLADRLEHHVGCKSEAVAGAGKPPGLVELSMFELHRGNPAVLADKAQRAGPGLDGDAVGLREFPLVPGRR